MINILLLSFSVSHYEVSVCLFFSVVDITHPKINLNRQFIKRCSHQGRLVSTQVSSVTLCIESKIFDTTHNMSDYRHLELEDDEYNETDHWGEDPIFSSIEEINTQIEEMKNFMSESKKRTEIQGTIIQEMRRRLSEAELQARLHKSGLFTNALILACTRLGME